MDYLIWALMVIVVLQAAALAALYVKIKGFEQFFKLWQGDVDVPGGKVHIAFSQFDNPQTCQDGMQFTKIAGGASVQDKPDGPTGPEGPPPVDLIPEDKVVVSSVPCGTCGNVGYHAGGCTSPEALAARSVKHD